MSERVRVDPRDAGGVSSTMMDEPSQVDALAACLEEYQRECAQGEEPDLSAFRSRLGDAFARFEALVDVFDRVVERPVVVGEGPKLPAAFRGYTLVRRLGKGGMGIVYEATHPDHEGPVALKLMRYPNKASSRQRFLREIEAARRIDHPSVVRILDAGADKGEMFYVMTRVAGRSLSARIRDHDVPPHRDLALAAASAADGLQALHDVGVVHRDVKPANLVFAEQASMVVTDLGLATIDGTTSLTTSSELLGTPRYMSPEQFMGEGTVVDARTDVYGLGASLYTALAGQAPFPAKTLRPLVKDILTGHPPSLHRAGSVPRALSQIVMQCIAHEPADRYPSMAALAEDLRRFADGRSTSLDSLRGRWSRLVRATRRRWRWIVGGLLLGLGALALFAWMSPNADATLSIGSMPGAEVSINGGPFRPAPLTQRVEPGEIAITLRADGFGRREIAPFRVKAGERYDREYLVFVVSDENDVEAMTQLARSLGWTLPLDVDPATPLPRARDVALLTPTGAPITLIGPRSAVRPDDLRSLHAELRSDYEKSGRIVIRIDDQLVFESEPVEQTIVRIEVPERVRKGCARRSAQSSGGSLPRTARRSRRRALSFAIRISTNASARSLHRFDRWTLRSPRA